MSLSITKRFLRRPILRLSFLQVRITLKKQSTVGGTSLAALRPGFFRGGRIQVLLKAPFEMTVGNDSGGDADEGRRYSGDPGRDRRGARGVTSDDIMARSGDREEEMDIMLVEVRSQKKMSPRWSDFYVHVIRGKFAAICESEVRNGCPIRGAFAAAYQKRQL